MLALPATLVLAMLTATLPFICSEGGQRVVVNAPVQ
jgi:hypothetical protein